MKFFITCLFIVSLTTTIAAQNTEKLPTYFTDGEAKIEMENLLPTTSVTSLGKKVELSFTKSKNNNLLHIEQIGSRNSIDVLSKVGSQQEIIQKGNKNLYSYKDYLFDSPMQLKVMQRGNSSMLKIFGANKLLNGAKIYQSKGSKVTINNF